MTEEVVGDSLSLAEEGQCKLCQVKVLTASSFLKIPEVHLANAIKKEKDAFNLLIH